MRLGDPGYWDLEIECQNSHPNVIIICKEIEAKKVIISQRHMKFNSFDNRFIPSFRLHFVSKFSKSGTVVMIIEYKKVENN